MNLTEYLVSCLGEEGCEISQCASKINRFGIDDVYTHIDESGKVSVKTDRGTNRSRLVGELNDLMAIVEVLVAAKVIPADWENKGLQAAKIRKLDRYLVYAKKVGTVK